MIGFAEKKYRVTLYKRDRLPGGSVCDIEIETFENAKPMAHSSGIVDAGGRLVFLTASGKEVLCGGIAYIAKET
jgi:hypothetical protein